MLLFTDTETEGMPLWREPSSDPRQPGVVELAALLTEDDGTERASFSLIVGDGPVPAEAAAIHGITTEVRRRSGVCEQYALQVFLDLLARADTFVAHNAPFDVKMLKILSARVGDGDFRRWVEADPSLVFCTMKAATPICRIHPPSGKRHADHWKWPKLEECARIFFGEEFTDAHGALADVRMCARVYFHLMSLKESAAPAAE